MPFSPAAIALKQGVGRTVVLELRLGGTFDLRDDALGQNLAQLYAPLIEAIDVPNAALREHAVFIEGYQFPQSFRRQPVGQNRIRRAVALESAVRDQRIRRALGSDLLRCFAKGER